MPRSIPCRGSEGNGGSMICRLFFCLVPGGVSLGLHIKCCCSHTINNSVTKEFVVILCMSLSLLSFVFSWTYIQHSCDVGGGVVGVEIDGWMDLQTNTNDIFSVLRINGPFLLNELFFSLHIFHVFFAHFFSIFLVFFLFPRM